jgi:hypothetical protein
MVSLIKQRLGVIMQTRQVKLVAYTTATAMGATPQQAIRIAIKTVQSAQK